MPNVVTDRDVFPSEKAARAYADKFEKAYRFQYPSAVVVKAMDGTVYYCFTSRLPNARKRLTRKI